MPFISHKPISHIDRCKDPEHNPPNSIVLKPGTHEYQCPKCGEITTINVSEITC